MQELVTEQTRMKYERIKEQISLMVKIMTALLEIGQNFETRTQAFQEDMKTLSKELMLVNALSCSVI